MRRRPTIIVAEAEPGQALSTRKLVLETAKFNVLTAHSTDEALDIFQSFPNASCLVAVDGEIVDCERVLKFARTIRDDIALSLYPLDRRSSARPQTIISPATTLKRLSN
jgi:hypothetical protein